MKRALNYLFSFLVFYLLVFVFVKAQQVGISSDEYFDQSVFDESLNNSSHDYSFFVISLFVLSFLSFLYFWKHRKYLAEALLGHITVEDELKKLDKNIESVGVKNAKIISEVEVHDVEEDSKSNINAEAQSTSADSENVNESVTESKTYSKDKLSIKIDYSDKDNPRLCLCSD